jgi:hypothetical protein
MLQSEYEKIADDAESPQTNSAATIVRVERVNTPKLTKEQTGFASDVARRSAA